MTAHAANEARTVLLIQQRAKKIYPLDPRALTWAQSSRRKLSTAYADAMVLDQDGLKKIERIDVLGPWGRSVGRRLLSRLTDAWSIKVHLSTPLDIPIAQLKQLITSCAANSDADWMPRDEMVAAISSAATARDVLDALRLPPPEDALDVL
jgi:hypothetical protein